MANYTNHKNNKPLSKEIVTEIQKRREEGQKKVHIAKEMGISHSVVRKYTIPASHFIDGAVKEEALRLLSLGQSRSSVAKTLGVNRSWVSKVSPEKGKKSNPIPEKIKSEFIQMIRAGTTATSAARTLKISQDTALSLINKQIGMPAEEVINEIKLKISSGESCRQIALEFELELYIVRRISKNKMDEAFRYTREEKLEIAKLYSLGLSVKEVVAKLGCTPHIVRTAYAALVKKGLVESRIELRMEDDRQLLRLQRRYPQFEGWREYALQWYKVVEGNFGICSSGIHKLFEYLAKNSLFEHPADFFLRQNAKLIPNFFQTVCYYGSDHGRATNNCLVDFFDWILIQPEFADFSDEGDPFTLPIFRNPLNKINRLDHAVQRGAESSKKVMPYWMISDLRRRIAQGPNFRDWKWAQTLAGKMTLSGDKESRDWFAINENQIDVSDPDCVYRTRKRQDGKSVIEMWSPVRWVACLLKMQTTARMGQIRMLDSGEADTFQFSDEEFVRNQGLLAKGTVRNPRRQGVLRQSAGKNLCLYFNTNKTADINKIGSEKGMECPWPKSPYIEDDPYIWLEKLRNWQAKYNPVSKLIAWKDIPATRRLAGKSETDCSTYPDAIFLFRTAESRGERNLPISPGALDSVWQRIITAYELILNQEGKRNPDDSPIKLVIDGRSEVSLHGLRVSLITQLILDGGMPPELMMKIVGHARFVMTLYYTKPGLQRIEDALSDAALKLDAIKDETLVRDLTSHSAEKVRNHAVFNVEELTDAIPLNPADRNPIGWLPMHDGICLAGGNSGSLNGDSRFPGCHNGGQLVDGPRKIYSAVPGGVRNCCRCRWKCAGKHHILGLQATLNNRQYHLYKASSSAIESERKRDDLLKQKAKTEFSCQPFEKMNELRSAERVYESAMHKMQELALDVAAVHRMIEQIKELPNDSDGPTALASHADFLTLHTMIEETDSELLVLAGICADVEFFTDLDVGTAIFEYAALMDKAFEREGKPLVLGRLSEHEKLIASNAIMRELEQYANPINPILARRKIVEIMDRGESLEMMLGINLAAVTSRALQSSAQTLSLRHLF